MANIISSIFTYEKSEITKRQNFEENKNWVSQGLCFETARDSNYT